MAEQEPHQSQSDLYFEDVEVGARFEVVGRAVTETDLGQFADLSGDHHPIHTDEAYAQTTSFGRRIAHGPLGIALAIGLFSQLQQFHKATIAMTDVRNWMFRAPVFIGDVLSLEVTIVEKPKRRAVSGIVQRRMRLLKQDGSVAQEGLSGLLMACRTTCDDTEPDIEQRNRLLNDEHGLDA